jgi:outer membrane protein assembly factor BamB
MGVPSTPTQLATWTKTLTCPAKLFDFEDGTLQGWTVLNECATDNPSFGGSPQVGGSVDAPDNSNYGGTKLVRSQNPGSGHDATTGIMESPHFKMCPGTTITLKIGGGAYNAPVDPENLVCGAGSTNVQLEYLDSGQWVRQEVVAAASNGVSLAEKAFATTSIGDACVTARLRAYDLNTGSWGHVTVDDIKIDPYEHVPLAPGSLLWSKNVVEQSSTDKKVMPGDIHNGVLFATEIYGSRQDTHDNLFALNVYTQEKIWSVKAVGAYGVNHSPIYDDGLVYAASGQGLLMALNASDGREVWSAQVSDKVQFHLVTPIIVGDAIIAPNTDGKAYARDKKTGTELWTYEFGVAHSGGGWSPAYGEGNVYFGSDNKNLYAVNVQTGLLAWQYNSDSVKEVRSRPAYHDGVVYFSHFGGSVLAVNATTGELIWEQEISTIHGDAYMCGVIYADGMVYMGTYTSATMHALDASTGAERWTYKGSGAISVTPTVADGVLYFASQDLTSRDGDLYALDSSDGSLLWEFKTDAIIEGFGTFTMSNGVFYIGDKSSKIYAVEAPAPATDNPTPGPTGNPTPGPTGNPTPGPTGNPTPGPTGNPTPAPTPGPTSQVDGLEDSIKILTELVTKKEDSIKILTELVTKNSEDLSKVSKELSEVKELLNQHTQGPSCYGRRAEP